MAASAGNSLLRLAYLSLAASALLLASASTVAWAQVEAEILSIVITLSPEGSVEVEISAKVSEGLNLVSLPAEPIPATILVEVDGETVPPLYEDGTLYVASRGPGEAEITYLALTRAVDGSLEFTVKPQMEVELRVNKGVILLSLPQGITSSTVEDGVVVIRFTGESTIRFTVAEAVEPPGGTPRQETPTPGDEAPAGDGNGGVAAPEQAGEGDGIPLALLIAAPIGAAAALYIALKYMRRGRSSLASVEAEVLQPEELDSTDREIIEALENMGGEALQSELQRKLGLPKSTLWRRLRRLESMGYIEIIREGKTNRVRLKRKG